DLYTFTMDDLAFIANLFYRCSYFHRPAFSSRASANVWRAGLFITVDNSSAIQIVGRKLHSDFIARQNAYEVLAHLAGNMRQHLMFVLQLHPEHGIGQRFQNRCHYLNRVFLAHSLLESSRCLSPSAFSNPFTPSLPRSLGLAVGSELSALND